MEGACFERTEILAEVPLWVLNMPSKTSVAVGILVKAGTRDESWPKEAGIAHALEHMHFQGTRDFPTSRDISGFIEEVGGRMNASTNNQRTFFYAHVPAEHADRAIRILSEQLNNPLLPENKIRTEMQNILQEIKRRNDNPRDYLSLFSRQSIYKGCTFSRDTLGLADSVVKFERDDFIKFRDSHYQNDNLSFFAVGNISIESARELFNRYFQKRPGKNSIVLGKTDWIPPSPGNMNVEKREIQQAHIMLSAITSSAENSQTRALDFFADMVSGGMSFPLFQEVRDKLGLCYTINANNIFHSDYGHFSIYAGTEPKKYRHAIEAIFSVLEKSRTDSGLLRKVKQLRLGNLAIAYESTLSILKSAVTETYLFGRPRNLEEIRKEIETVQMEEIIEAFDRFLGREKFFTNILAPSSLELD